MSRLDLNHLTKNPRLRIKSKTHGDDDGMYANDEYFIYCSHASFTLIHKNGHEQKLPIKRKFPVLNICWSTYLQKFFVLSGHGDNKLYLLDPIKQQLKLVKSSRKPKIMQSCACHHDILLLSYTGKGARIEEYRLSLSLATVDDEEEASSADTVDKKESSLATTDNEESSLITTDGDKESSLAIAIDKEESSSAVADEDEESIIKSLENPVQVFKSPITCEKDQSIVKMCFNSDGTYLGLILYQFDDDTGGRPEQYTWFELRAFRHAGDEMVKCQKHISVSSDSPLLAVSFGKFLILRSYDSSAVLIEHSSKKTSAKKHDDHSSDNNTQIIAKETSFSMKCPAKAAAICGTCLAMKTYDDEIHFYDL